MKSFLSVILIGIFLNGLCWQLVIPVWGYPDEQAHFAQIQDFVQSGRAYVIPNGNNTSREIALSEKIMLTERDSLGNNYYTYNPQNKIPYIGGTNGLGEQAIKDTTITDRTTYVKKEATVNPPFYYKLAAGFYALTQGKDLFYRVFAVRFFSLILLVATAYVAYKSGILIFADRLKAYLLVVLVGYMPMFVYATTGIFPDPLTNLLMSLVIYLNLHILFKGIGFFKVVLLILVILAGVFTRQQFLIALPISFAAVFLRYVNSTRKLALVFGVFIVFGSLVILTTLYGGNTPFIRNIMVPDTQIFDFKNVSPAGFAGYLADFVKTSYRQTFPWYWGVYKWLSLTLPNYLYVAAKLLLIFSAIGVVWRYVDVVKNKRYNRTDRSLTYLLCASGIYIALFVVWNYFFQLHNGYDFGVQGRYFFPTIVAHMAVILIGCLTLAEKIHKKLLPLGVITLMAIFFLLNMFSLFYVASSYYLTNDLGTFLNHLSYFKPDILKGQINLIVITGSLAVQVLIFALMLHALKITGKKEYNLTNESDF